MVTTSLEDEDLIRRIRDSLNDISENQLPSGTIMVKHDQIVEPYLERNTSDDVEQDAFDNAAVAYTAELAYKAIPAKSTVSAGGVTANVAVSQYIDSLEENTSIAFAEIGVTPPREGGPAAITERTDGMLR